MPFLWAAKRCQVKGYAVFKKLINIQEIRINCSFVSIKSLTLRTLYVFLTRILPKNCSEK